jgi:tetratricopeptide (TPR) repeat protein
VQQADDQARFEAAVDRYEQALATRDKGDHAHAFEMVDAALASIERLQHSEAAVARARFAITRADLAARIKSTEDAIAVANDAVARARRVAKLEPTIEASALYMLGKAERPSLAHSHGAGSFEKSLALWRKHEGDRSVYAADAASSLGAAYLKIGQWQRARDALDLVIANDPDGPELIQYLNRAIACERLSDLDAAKADIEGWLAGAATRPYDERLRGYLCTSRIYASRGEGARASDELATAVSLSRELPAADARRALMLEALAWHLAIAANPPWLLASEVLMRRAAALSWSPVLADTASRIAGLWRPGVEEDLIQPTFATLEVEACLEVWNASQLAYVAREGRQQMQLVIAGAPTTIERLADDRWRELAVQRIFSTFHAEQFDAHDSNFVAPVRSMARRLRAQHVLQLLPSLRVPVWATTKTVALSSIGEIEVMGEGELAALAVRSTPLADDEALAALLRAVPSLDREAGRALLVDPPEMRIMPPAAIPLMPSA